MITFPRVLRGAALLLLLAGLLAGCVATQTSSAPQPAPVSPAPPVPATTLPTTGMLHHYAFAEGSGSFTRNLLDPSEFGSLIIGANPPFGSQPPQDFPRWVTGRTSGTAALRIGTALSSVGRSHFYGVDGHDFSVAMWVRTDIAPGTPTRAVLATVGDAWSTGWRLEANGYSAAFILGRTPGEGAGKGVQGVSSKGALAPGVWHLVVGVLADTHLQLFVDGALAGQQEFDGIYQQLPTPAGRFTTPEIDFGGLQLGTSRSHKSAGHFDVDELALYGRALSAAEIAQSYTAGQPVATPAAQLKQYQDEEARRAQLDAISISLPADTFGYFPRGLPLPVSVRVAPAAGALLGTAGSVQYVITTAAGQPATAASEPLTVTPATGAAAEHAFDLTTCGLYHLAVQVRDAQQQPVKSAGFDFAIRLPLPARAAIPASAPLADYAGLDYETPSFGASMERVIQPIWGRQKDGTPDYTYSDAHVAAIQKQGLGVLYCLGLPAPVNGKWLTVAELAANPAPFAEHVRALATRYRGQVHHWEILNEPNAGFPGMTAAIYVQLLKTARAAIKEVDPTALIVGPCGTSNYHDWTEEVLAAGGGSELDILSFHNYLGASPIENCFGFARLRSVQASLQRHLGHQLPLWNSECGIHQPARLAGLPATDAQLLRLYGGRASTTPNGVKVGVDAIMMVNEHRSAAWQVQSLLLELGEGVQKYFLLMRSSQPYPAFTGVGNTVTEKGVALAALQSVIIPLQSARLLPTGVPQAAGVLLTDTAGHTTAALFADRPGEQTFVAADRAGVTLSGMDMLGNPLTWVTEDGGLVTLPLASEPVYLFNVPTNFAAAPGVQFNAPPLALTPLTTTPVAAVITNPFDHPLTATLSARVSCGSASVAPKSITLAPHASAPVTVQWQTGRMWKGRHWVRLELRTGKRLLASGLAENFTCDGMVNPVPALAGQPALDGATAKWRAGVVETAADAEHAVIGRPVEGAPNPAFWRGPDDLSYTFTTGWTAAGLWFRVLVRDDVLRPARTPEERRQGYIFDCLELFVDCRPAASRVPGYSAGATQYIIVPEVGTTLAPCQVQAMGKLAPVAQVSCAGQAVSQGYVIEGLIAPVAGGPWTPQAGARLNLDVAVDDNDDLPGQPGPTFGRRVQMTLHGSARNSVDTADWGRYELK